MAKNRNKVLHFNDLGELANKLTVKLIMTPRSGFTDIEYQESVGEARNLMNVNDNDYSQLPVKNKGKIVGLLHKVSICSVPDEVCVSKYMEKLEDIPKICETQIISKVFELLCPRDCIFVEDENGIAGLIHRSDLNKQGVRIYFYLWLSAAEIGLAQIIERAKINSDAIINCLKKGDKKRFKIDRENDRNLNPIEYCDFSALINMVTREKMWKSLGFTSGNKWKEATSGLVDLRIVTMHPVRKLVKNSSDSSDIEKLNKRDLKVKSLIGKL